MTKNDGEDRLGPPGPPGVPPAPPWRIDPELVGNAEGNSRALERDRQAAAERAQQQEGRPLGELRSSGLLWLINTVVFHPRGFALALHVDDSGAVTGWSLQGDGTEAWTFADHQTHFQRAKQTLRGAGEGGNRG
jgi:hypothetical protein